MEKLNCIIVEDEPLAAEIISDYISQTPGLKLAGVYSDALFAMQALQQQQVDVMFLDIHLPRLRGLDFIRTLTAPPQIIITTAYRDYALDGYELNVTDYLLKPVSFSRFLMAVNKLKGRAESHPAPVAPSAPEKKYLLINVSKKKIRVYPEEILYIESRKEYINIVTAAGSYLTRIQLSEIETQLDKSTFLRVHRSFIISIPKVRAYNATRVEVQEHVIPVGRSYKEIVGKRLGKAAG